MKKLLAIALSLVMMMSVFAIPTFAEGESVTVRIHYLREDGNYADWDVWFWTEGGDAEYPGEAAAFFDTVDDNGAVTEFTIEGTFDSIGFIIRVPDWSAKDPDGDRKITADKVTGSEIDVYCVSGSELDDFRIEVGGDEPASSEEEPVSSEEEPVSSEEEPVSSEEEPVSSEEEPASSEEEPASSEEEPASSEEEPASSETTDSKPNSDTGVEGIAVAAGLAVLATGAAIVAKKRK